MRRPIGLIAVVATLVCAAHAQGPAFDNDGWYSWRVAAVADAPALCCYEWRRGRISNPGCDLDDRSHSFGTDSNRADGTSSLEVYVRVVSGDIRAIETVSAGCPVHSATPIADLGDLDSSRSMSLLEELIDSGGEPAEDALRSIAFHSGASAEEFIVRTGRSHSHPGLRAEAWFWLAQRAAPGAEAVIRLAVAEDVDEDVREEAVFALSQLPEERAVRALIEVLEDRQLDREQREEALFWLGQTGANAAYDYIDALLSRN